MTGSRPDRGTANRPTSRSQRLPCSTCLVSSPSNHPQCRLFPFPNLLSQCARFRQPTSCPPPSIHLPRLNTHHPNRFLSQAPTSRDPFLAPQGLLCPPTKPKARQLVTVEVAVAGIQSSRLSPRHRHPGYARTTRSPARQCRPARARRLSSPTPR